MKSGTAELTARRHERKMNALLQWDSSAHQRKRIKLPLLSTSRSSVLIIS